MEQYKQEFIEFMVDSEVLKFGEFTLKSGRKSPFFMNAGGQRDSFNMLVEETLGDDCQYDTVIGIHEKLNEIIEAHQFFPHTQHHQRSTSQIYSKSHSDILSLHTYKISDIQDNAGKNEQQFQCSKLNRAFLIPQISERNSLESVHCNYNQHHPHIPRMLSISQETCYGIQKRKTNN